MVARIGSPLCSCGPSRRTHSCCCGCRPPGSPPASSARWPPSPAGLPSRRLRRRLLKLQEALQHRPKLSLPAGPTEGHERPRSRRRGVARLELEAIREHARQVTRDIVFCATGFLDHKVSTKLIDACRATDVRFHRVNRGRPLTCLRAVARDCGRRGPARARSLRRHRSGGERLAGLEQRLQAAEHPGPAPARALLLVSAGDQ